MRSTPSGPNGRPIGAAKDKTSCGETAQQRRVQLDPRTRLRPASARQRTTIAVGAGKLARYRKPSLARSSTELAVTAVPFLALWLLMWLSLGLGYWLTLILAVPAAGFLVRLFMIQHDCGHGSFFRRRWADDWLGRAIGVLTLTAYGHWAGATPSTTPPAATSTGAASATSAP